MKTFKHYSYIPKDFTGICKILDDKSICYCKNGKIHREDGPAIIYRNGATYWYLNGLQHRESGPAIDFDRHRKSWYYKDICYGRNNEFTNETWLEKVKELKYKEMLEIFK